MVRQIVPPALVIVMGIAWLLNVVGMLPGVDWLWTVGVAAVGILVLTFGGINRVTVVVCPTLIVASIFSVMRQTGRLSFDKEVPFLTIALGVFWLLASATKVPLPKALLPEEETRKP